MKLSEDLQISVTVAHNEAANRRHEFLTLEHLLFALLHDQQTAEVIRQCGGDVGWLKKKLDQYLTDEMTSLPEAQQKPPTPTVARIAVALAAFAAVQSGSNTPATERLPEIARPRPSSRRQFLTLVIEDPPVCCLWRATVNGQRHADPDAAALRERTPPNRHSVNRNFAVTLIFHSGPTRSSAKLYS